ncbi:metallophosphoesterase [Actinophytocola sp.]|uniref:metallophosphoesterase n=1 Tax=Actinophytocola sp. TaxID=1872138 RepID=UPI002D7E664E|nr:metallophosphoesterase [Actinophytocola sp.]HET9141438.1 metallophosphoesterase [Actinophytocola sp.]
MSQTVERARSRRRSRPRWRFLLVVLTALTLLFGLPWWTLVVSPGWPAPVLVVGTGLFACAAAAFPWLMYLGHGRNGRDGAARTGDTLLGVMWVLFAWSLLGTVARGVLGLFGVGGLGRIVALAVLAVATVLVAWGAFEAMRVPRTRTVEVRIPRLGPGLDGTRVVVLADTHFGPIDRTRWSTGLAAAVNRLGPDIVAHAGDIADGTVARRRSQAAPLGAIDAPLGKVFVTGNHEYYGEALTWIDHLTELGWQHLHNRHVVVERGGDRLVLAGVDDATALGSGLPGHGADLPAALAGAEDGLPVLLVAHQPRQVDAARAAGVDLQVSGHTHGGQIWPFHYLVRVDQPSVQGLSRHGERTQLYTSRGAGFWGPPLRVFAPSEISLLILRAG